MKKNTEHYKLIIERVGKEMNKKEYIAAVKEELAGLKPSDLKKEVQKLEKKIATLEKKQLSWTEIQKKLGSSKEYAGKILEKHEKNPIEWCNVMLAKLIHFLTDWIQELAEVLSNPKIKDIVRIITVLCLTFLIVSFLKFPFLLLMEIMNPLFNIFQTSISSVVHIGIKGILDLCYYTSIFVVTAWMINKYIIEYFKTKERLSFETKENQKILAKGFQNVAAPLLIAYKIIGFLFMIPFLILTLFFLITMIVSIALVINQVGYIYMIILSIGLAIFFGAILLFLATFVFQKRHHTWQKLKYCLFGIAILIVAFAMIPIEYLGYTKINHNVLLEDNSITKNYTIEPECFSAIKIYNNGKKNHINYIVDNSVDNVIVEVIYPSEYYDLSYASYSDHDEMVINYQTKIQDGKGYELFSKLFYYYVTKTEQKLRYSYTDVNFPDITIRANEENMRKITHNL